MKIICYYHNDPDGITAAGIVKKYYNELNNGTKLLLSAIQYGYDYEYAIDKYSDCDRCIIVDFSFPKEIMNQLYEKYKGNNLIWIDHHQTAMEQNLDLWNDKGLAGKREIGKSGCLLTWEFFFPYRDEPDILLRVNDLDLWEFKYADTKQFIEGFCLNIKYPDDDQLQLMLNDDCHIYDYIVEQGDVLVTAQQKRVESKYKHGIDIIFEGHVTRLINSTTDQSQLGEYCYKDNLYPIAMIYSIKDDKVIFQLRSNTVDVGTIAKKYLGGGHMFASGFQKDISFLGELYAKD